MSDERNFKNRKVLERAVDVVDRHNALSSDIVNDYELRYSNLEGHVLAIYSADDASSPHALTPYFDDLRTYNVKDYFAVPTNKNYYIVDITEYTGKDLPPLAEEDSEDRFQGILGEQSTKEAIEDKDEEDKVNQPSHYTSGDIEVIEYIEQQAKVMYDSGTVPPEVIPHICNAIKYISRFQSKGKAVEDLQKSVYYINRAIKNIENSKEWLDGINIQEL